MSELNEKQDSRERAPIGKQELKYFCSVLGKYKAAGARDRRRMIAAENWWRLRNTAEEEKRTGIGRDGGFVSKSGWLHNVIVSKHADAMEAYPAPVILGREEADAAEAELLGAVLPCVLEQNDFESTYDKVMWQKTKTGTGAYKIVWDQGKLFGLGDISIESVNLLNLYFEPGISDIQKSRYVFQTQLCDKELLLEKYPEQLRDGFGSNIFSTAKFLFDDKVDTDGRVPLIEVYYHKYVDGKKTLQYCKFVNDKVLFATENDIGGECLETGERIREPMARVGLYAHAMYPYVLDPLFPIDGSPLGYGYVDICKNPQTEIDLLKTSFVKNAMVGALPRYFKRAGGGVNEEQFLDLTNPLVEVEGNLDEIHLRPIEHVSLDSNYVNILDRTIQELRETSGNTQTSTGNISSGVTAASAIIALQEASIKGSKDSTKGSYRAFSQLVWMCIELMREFYDAPRTFRIVGEHGMRRYVSYDKSGLAPKHQGQEFGQDMGYRAPSFDIRVYAKSKNAYTKLTQNELALKFFDAGFFDPAVAPQALICLEMMDFDGKDAIEKRIRQRLSQADSEEGSAQDADGACASPTGDTSLGEDMARAIRGTDSKRISE